MELVKLLILEGFFLSLIVGVIGTLIVLTNSASLTGSVSHANFGAVGLSFYLGIPAPFIPVVIAGFSGLIGAILATIILYLPHRRESLINGVWAIGMGSGILFISLGGIQNGEVMSYLFGNLLFITPYQLGITAGIAGIALFLLPIGKIVLHLTYDHPFLQLRGVKSGLLYSLYLIFTSVIIGALVQIVGIILLLALFTLPPLIAERFVQRFYPLVFTTMGVTFGAMVLSILLSYVYPIPLLPVVAIVLAVILIGVMVFKRG